jgi:hypothetical protein
MNYYVVSAPDSDYPYPVYLYCTTCYFTFSLEPAPGIVLSTDPFEENELTEAMDEELDSFCCPKCSSYVRSTEYLSDISSHYARRYYESMLWQ